MLTSDVYITFRAPTLFQLMSDTNQCDISEFSNVCHGTYIAASCQRLNCVSYRTSEILWFTKIMFVYIYFLSHQGIFVTLACTKHGSRCLDAIWNAATLKQKILIMDELSTKEAILNSDRYGSILSTNYCLSLYKHTPNEWKDLQGKEFRKKQLFADIIGDLRK